MSDRIDHAAEAERFAAWADNPALPPENVTAIASMAQAHATLALVEQQRIANLIALAHVADMSDATVSPLEQTAWEALGVPGSGQMRPEIKEALGLS